MIRSRGPSETRADDDDVRLRRQLSVRPVVLQRMGVVEPEWFTVDGYLDRERRIQAERAQQSLKLSACGQGEAAFPLGPLQLSCKPL
jgi:hypothetical protein